MSDIILDPSIRDWVVLPMVLIMILVGVTRHYVTLLLKSDKPADIVEMKNMQTLQRSQRTRTNGQFCCSQAFGTRKFYFTSSEKLHGVRGALRQKVRSGPVNPMTNPSGMVDALKGNMAFMVPNVVMMGLISYFFAGFVLVKVPFSLTMRFKQMLQRGIELSTLDVSYVSSLSWYFLVMFGMRGFQSLLLGEGNEGDSTRDMQMQMGFGNPQNMGFDAAKAFKQERDSLELHVHESKLDDVERRLLGDIIVPKEKSEPIVREQRSSKFNKIPRRPKDKANH